MAPGRARGHRAQGPGAVHRQLDLPGGSPEPGETASLTLARELDEECGVQLVSHGAWTAFELHVTRTSAGEAIDLRHRGLLAAVTVAGPDARVQDVEDVAAVELVDPRALPDDELSPLLRHALRVLHL